MCITGKRGASGQATFEYLFLIFFTVILISGFAYQFNGALRSYFDGYFSADGYLACLIEKGILPGESSDDGTCDPPTFDMNKGQQRQVASVDFGNGNGGKYNGGGRGSEANAGAGSTGRMDEGYGKTVPTGAAAAGAFKKNGAAGTGKKAGGGGNTGNDGFSTSANAGAGSDESGPGSSRANRIPYRDTSSTTVNAKKESNVPTTGRDLKTSRQIAAEKTDRKLKEKKSDGNFDLSFGNILKWVFLILILFAIIFFIGSQIVAISNGNKKRR